MWLIALLTAPAILLIIIGRSGWLRILDLRWTTRLCFFVSVFCASLSGSMIVMSVYIERKTYCSNILLNKQLGTDINIVRAIAIAGSLSAVIFFAINMTERRLSELYRRLDTGELKDVIFYFRGTLVTDTHFMVLFPLYGFLALALAVPARLFVFVRDLVMWCEFDFSQILGG